MGKIAVDHLGKAYPSYKEMCKQYGVSYGLFANRRRSGWSVEKALTTPVLDGNSHATRCVEAEDHLGNKFSSQKEMCEYWDIPQSVFSARKAARWTVEKCLTTPVNKICIKACVDHLGNKYNSITAMCRAWGIEYSNYYSRVYQRGWSLKNALETPIHG